MLIPTPIKSLITTSYMGFDSRKKAFLIDPSHFSFPRVKCAAEVKLHAEYNSHTELYIKTNVFEDSSTVKQ